MTQQTDDDTFTLREMREAYRKYMEGKPLTEKERKLAEAKHAAVRATSGWITEE